MLDLERWVFSGPGMVHAIRTSTIINNDYDGRSEGSWSSTSPKLLRHFSDVGSTTRLLLLTLRISTETECELGLIVSIKAGLIIKGIK